MASRKLSIQKEIAFIALIVGSGVIAVFAVVGQHGLLRLQAKDAEYQTYAARKAELEAENEALKARNRKLQDDPATLMLEIRKRLGYALPDEIVFQDTRPAQGADPGYAAGKEGAAAGSKHEGPVTPAGSPVEAAAAGAASGGSGKASRPAEQRENSAGAR
ncbi:MAG: septum formation initiator family protein [Acidobacteria bacterium]|nr:septum formation initiator family protein [Acidobacteriota bacterium]